MFTIIKGILVTGLLALGANAATQQSQFFANYDTLAEAMKESDKLNTEILEEGITLLKNDDNALPLASTAKVSVFGKYSSAIKHNGAGSGSGSGGKTISFVDSLKSAGLQVNPDLVSFYSNSGKSGSTGTELTGYTQNSGYKNFETPVSKLEQYVDTSSYSNYNDAAIIVISRRGMEAADLPKGMSQEFNDDGSLNSDNPIDGARAYDDHSLQPTQTEADLIKYVSQYFDKIILCFNTGSQFEAGFLDDPGHYAYSSKIKAAVWFGFPGMGEGFNALGRIITGEVNPSGHTVDTWARDFKNDPTWDNSPLYSKTLSKYTNLSNKYFVNYKEGIYYGYHYYETRGFTEGVESYSSLNDDGTNKIHVSDTTDWSSWYNSAVVYPLGHGLSYTTFDWQIVNDADSKKKELTENGQYSIDVQVTNTGNVAGKDVVQLYASAPYTKGGIAKSYVNLIGYEKTSLLQPGASEIVTLTFSTRDLASYDYNDANKNGFTGYEAEAGDYVLKISKNAHESVLEKTYVAPEGGFAYNKAKNTDTTIKNLFSDAEDKSTTYLSRDNWEGTWPQAPTDLERIASQDTLNTVSTYESNSGIIAADDPSDPWYSDTMPTTGNNTGSIKLEDLKDLSYDDPKWEEYLNQFAVGTKSEEGMTKTIWNAGWHINGIDGVGLNTTHQTDGPSGFDSVSVGGSYSNFCSEVVLASTYNKDLAYRKGIQLGNEALFGNNGNKISGIYAPSVNLHRTPFGGRNFEYYSEDAYISGEMAGNVIKGANEKGLITYLKHFAVNEQETNRENILTWANEQTLREIYFKSFQICVEDYGSHGIMTALNSLGAVWTGGNYSLVTSLLRKEWGFSGLVITDYVQGRPQLNGNLAIRAGGDILLAKSGSQQYPAGLDSPTTVTQLRRAMKNIAYSTLHYTATYQGAATNILGQYKSETLSPAIAGREYSQSVNTVKTNDGSVAKEVVKYSLKEGDSLPSGLTLSEDGVISGIADPIYESRTFTIQAKYEHSIRTATFTLPVVDENKSVIYIKPNDVTLSDAYINESYSQNINWAYLANGEQITINYSLGDGSLLPEGMTLETTGMLSGTPTKPIKDYKFVVQASCAGKYPMSVSLSVNVGKRITLEDKELEQAKVNERYVANLSSSDDLSFSLKEGNSLPEGLTLTEEGQIVGTPTQATQNYEFTVIVSGQDYISCEKTYSIDIGISYTSFSLDNMTQGKETETYVNFASGASDITYTISEGSLPKGLSLTEDGIIKGTPAESGNYSFTIKATSSDSKFPAEVKVTLYVNPMQTSNNYATGMMIGIAVIVFSAIAIILFFIFFDKNNHIDNDGDGGDSNDGSNGTSSNDKSKVKKNKKKRKANFKALIASLSSFAVIGVTVILCMCFLAPTNSNTTSEQTYIFEAEYVNLDNFHGAGISNSADGVNNIYGDGNEKDIEKGWSNGYFLGNTYAVNSIDFVVESDSKSNGKLIMRFASELGNMSLTPEAFGIEVNGTELDYSMLVQGSSQGNYDFKDYPINGNISLLEGENTIRLSIKENTLQGGNRTGAPLIDCIKVTTDANLTWTPLTDNPSMRGSV